MAARPLLFGADGLTPVAFEDDGKSNKERGLLLACFGALVGVNTQGREPSAARLYEDRQYLAKAIVDLLGQDVVEHYFRIQLAPSDSPGPAMPTVEGVQ